MIDGALLEPHRTDLWALAYRMTGVAADADEVVQDTFLRAFERTPDLSRPLGPWLRAVALNLGRDRLRRRRRGSYVGPWLPVPVDCDGWIGDLDGPEGRVGRAESLSYGFLVALEALSPQQRAVLLARDVLDLDGEETAAWLGMSAGNVRVTLHRARRLLAGWEARRRPIDAAHAAAVTRALGRLLACLATGDLEGAKAAFSDDAVSLSDGGGEVFAARVPLFGRERIATVFWRLARHATVVAVEVCARNGLPAVLGQMAPKPGEPPSFLHLIELAPDGRIARLYSVLAPRKLASR